MIRQKHSHCSYCGHPFGSEGEWPRACAPCGNTSYVNPLPVAVALVPVDGGLLCIRRTIPPKVGELALPGGYLEANETWQEGCVRELREETGIIADSAEVKLFTVHSAAKVGSPLDAVLLVFGVVSERKAQELSVFTANEETSEMVVIRTPIELAFPLHTLAVQEYFRRMGV